MSSETTTGLLVTAGRCGSSGRTSSWSSSRRLACVEPPGGIRPCGGDDLVGEAAKTLGFRGTGGAGLRGIVSVVKRLRSNTEF